MISIVIAVKEPATSRRYRQMIAPSGFGAHYATSIVELARIVKSRPIDAVIFDLGMSSLPASEWLEIVAKDSDLTLTPVLWIGTNIAQKLKSTIEDHRPGLWLKTMPKADELIAAVLQLIGRKVGDGAPIPITPPSDSHEWLPQETVIDSALQIFEEGGAERRTASPAGDYDVQITHTGAYTQRPSNASSAPPQPATPAAPPDSDDEIEVAVSEVTTMPGATGPKRTISMSGSRPPAVAHIDLDSSAESKRPVDEIDEIVDLVTERLASKLAKQIDVQMIRREIAVVMRQREG
ncbi:MAG: hypothetical protein Kow0074_10460 [Candidatus Zixiibacteriota bacterium]